MYCTYDHHFCICTYLFKILNLNSLQVLGVFIKLNMNSHSKPLTNS